MNMQEEFPHLLTERPVHRIGGNELASLLGVTLRMITTLIERDIVVKINPGVYDMGESVRRYCAHLRETAAGRGGEEQVLNLTGERARLAREQADSQALKNSIARGDHLPASEVLRTWSETLRATRSRMLAVPSRLRTELPHLTNSDFERIDRELRNALEELGRADD